MKGLITLSGGITGLLMIAVGTLTPSAIIHPDLSLAPRILSLPSTWQVPALLICTLVCGWRAGVIASTAYISIGLFQLPIFYGGGYFNYIYSPSFGFLIGFIPASLFTVKLLNTFKDRNITNLTLSALAGVLTIQLCGTLNLLTGLISSRWNESFQDLIINYSLAPLLAQILICPAVGLISLYFRRILIIE
tara:strand:- start:25 stop:597 length:573 start_codon:yes stop_codon:yes gene_type:complete